MYASVALCPASCDVCLSGRHDRQGAQTATVRPGSPLNIVRLVLGVVVIGAVGRCVIWGCIRARMSAGRHLAANTAHTGICF
jgi:hypothetical protein